MTTQQTSDRFTCVCPECRAKYKVPEDKRGQTFACQKCQTRFMLDSTPPTPQPEPEQEQPTGFFGKLRQAGKQALEKAQNAGDGRSMKEILAEHRGDHLRATDAEAPPFHLWKMVKFCGCSLQTDFGLDPNSQLFCYFAESCLILRAMPDAFKMPKVETTEEVLRIPLVEIEKLEVETADRMTLGRIGAGYLLAGPFGAIIGGMWRKKDKFLRVDWGGEHSVVFGKSKVKADELKQLVTKAIREVKGA